MVLLRAHVDVDNNSIFGVTNHVSIFGVTKCARAFGGLGWVDLRFNE